MGKSDGEAYLKSQPFQPFSMLISNGRRLGIQHPEMVVLTRSAITVALPDPGGKDVFRTITISLIHVVEIELLVRG